MKIAVIILNWNGKELLRSFLPSVIKNSPEASIYVADNASTDDSVDFLKSAYPQVTIIRNKENAGYAGGYNRALKQVSEELHILLNSDVEVSPGWLVPILKAFEKDHEIGAIQPKILDYNHRNHFEYAGAAGGYIDKFGYPFCRGRIFEVLEEDHGQYNDDTYIFWASGACLAIKKEAFEKVGGFDEDFFAHQEEIDLCWRLQKAGYRIFYVANSRVFHVGGATLDQMNPRKTFYNFRNSLYLLLKNVDGNNVYLILFIRMILDGIAGIKFVAEGKFTHFFAVLQAHASFYTNFKLLKYKRNRKRIPYPYFKVVSIISQHFLMGRKKYSELLIFRGKEMLK